MAKRCEDRVRAVMWRWRARARGKVGERGKQQRGSAEVGVIRMTEVAMRYKKRALNVTRPSKSML